MQLANSLNISDKKIIGSMMAFGLGFAGLAFLLGLDGINGLILIGICIAFLMTYVLVKYERFWIYSLMGISPIFFYGSKAGISPNDVFMSLYLNVFTFIWLIYIIFIKKERIVHSISDWLMLMFYFFSLLTVVNSLNNDIPFINFIKEYALFSTCLIYFPLKYYIKDKKDIINLLIILTIALTFADLYHFYLYKSTALQDVLYAYQLGTSVRINQTIFTTAAFTGLIFTIYAKSIKARLIILSFSAITTFALVVTFSRTFWLILIVLVAIAFVLLPIKRKRILTTLILIVVTLSLSVTFLVFKDNAKIFLKVAENRITSVEKGSKDESVKARLVEYESVYRDIERYPLSGMGLGTKVRVYDYFKFTTSYIANIHNSYLFIMHRWGIPLGIIFLFIMFYNAYFSFIGIFKMKDDFYKILAYSAFAAFFTLIVASTTSAQFFQRDSQFVIAIAMLFVNKINEQKSWI